MKVLENLNTSISQAEFASVIGVSEAKVSQLITDGVLERGDSAHLWLIAYCERLRGVAAGRLSGEIGGLDLVQERAALAREQRRHYELKNAIAAGEYAPVKLLSQVLATASQAVVERFQQLPSALRKACPDLPEAARDQVMAVIAEARNAWAESAVQLVMETYNEEEADDPSAE